MIATSRIAVVILNWNGRDMLREFLPSVVRHSEPEGFVIVADNGSTDGSLEMLANEFPQVTTLPLGENFGFAEGYNRALSEVEAPYFLLLNSDVEVTPHWLQPLLSYMEAHPEVAACQPKMRAQTQKQRFEYAGAAGGFLDKYGYPFCRGRLMNEIEEDFGQYDEPCSIFWASGAALMIRSADWKEAGGLDGRFFAHMEEIDLCWRLRARGRKLVCLPQSVVFHVGGGTLGAGNPRKTFFNFRNNALLLFKNLPQDELKGVMRARKWLDLLAACRFLLAFDFKNFKAVCQARKAFLQMHPDFEKDRAENLRRSLHGGKHLAERFEGSLLWNFYIKGRRKFSDLPF